MSHIGKRYRIEQSFASPDGGVLVSGSGDGRIGEILSTVQDLRRCFEPSQRRAGEVIEAYRREIAELYGLKAELDSMKGAIASTKREIATLRRSEDDGAGMRRAAGELDAVIEATEDATTTILAAAEEIESHATMLRAAGVATGNNDCVGAILDRTVALYEACNFQDLTGQRISKVMGTMKFIEQHINAMMDIWGGVDAIKAHAPAIIDTREGDAKLLNGPKLDGDDGHASQNDIDALFD
ncbi:MAG: protein phosphatase CheZ [Microvirga sp.]